MTPFTRLTQIATMINRTLLDASVLSSGLYHSSLVTSSREEVDGVIHNIWHRMLKVIGSVWMRLEQLFKERDVVRPEYSLEGGMDYMAIFMHEIWIVPRSPVETQFYSAEIEGA